MEKILIIQTAFIGDAILTLPMIQKLKEKFPESLIDIIAIPSTEQIFAASPFVNEVVVLEKRTRHKSISSLLKFASELKLKNYNRLYSPHRSLRSAIIVMQLGIKETFGFDNSSLKHVYKHLIKYDYNKHEVQRNLDLIDINYENDWNILPELKINGKQKKNVDDFFVNYSAESKFFAVAIGSAWNTKRYPIEYFEKIINYLEKKNFIILLIGGEGDKNLCDKMSENFGENVISAAGKFSLLESIEILKRADILLSNDSAPTHLGMCADIPVLTLYCSTVQNFGFYPYNPKSEYLSYDNLSCKPCGIHGFDECPLHTFDCGYKLKPELVISKIEEMINVKN